MLYTVIVWNNDGQRTEVRCHDRQEAFNIAKAYRTRDYRTVKIGESGEAIRHWTRTDGAHGNQWSAHSTAECSR